MLHVYDAIIVANHHLARGSTVYWRHGGWCGSPSVYHHLVVWICILGVYFVRGVSVVVLQCNAPFLLFELHAFFVLCKKHVLPLGCIFFNWFFVQYFFKAFFVNGQNLVLSDVDLSIERGTKIVGRGRQG